MSEIKELKRIDVISLAKIQGFVMAIGGLFVGILVTLFSVLLGGLTAEINGPVGFGSLLGFGSIFGLFGIFFIPIMLGISGFISGAAGAIFYNTIADWVGGVKLELEDDRLTGNQRRQRELY